MCSSIFLVQLGLLPVGPGRGRCSLSRGCFSGGGSTPKVAKKAVNPKKRKKAGTGMTVFGIGKAIRGPFDGLPLRPRRRAGSRGGSQRRLGTAPFISLAVDVQSQSNKGSRKEPEPTRLVTETCRLHWHGMVCSQLWASMHGPAVRMHGSATAADRARR